MKAELVPSHHQIVCSSSVPERSEVPIVTPIEDEKDSVIQIVTSNLGVASATHINQCQKAHSSFGCSSTLSFFMFLDVSVLYFEQAGLESDKSLRVDADSGQRGSRLLSFELFISSPAFDPVPRSGWAALC